MAPPRTPAKILEICRSYNRNPSRRREGADASSPLTDPRACFLAPSAPRDGLTSSDRITTKPG